MKQEKETLLKDRKSLKEDRQQYFFVKKEQVNLHDELKELQDISHKEVNAELNTDRIRDWIFRNLKKVHKI